MKRPLGRVASLSSLIVALALALALPGCGGGTSPQPPKAASDVTATPGPGYVTVRWTDNSDNETGFRILRSEVAGSTTASAKQVAEFASVGPDVTSIVDRAVEPGQAYRYSVVAENAAGGSAAVNAATTASVPVGVDLLVGTNNRRFEDANGTIFIVYFVFPESVLTGSEPFEVTLSGPATWNGDQPLRYTIPENFEERLRGFIVGSYHGITAMNGSYRVVVTVDGTTYEASYELTTADFSLDPPTDIVASGASDSINATWSNPAGGRSAWVSARLVKSGEIVAGYALTDRTEHSFTGLSLGDGLYSVEVATMNSDLTVNFPHKQEPFGLSYDSVSFGVGDYVSPLCASPEEEVTIPDAALLGLVRAATGTPSGPLTCARMAELEALDGEEAGVSSLEGLQYASNLVELELTDNNVEDITPIAELTNLRSLNLNVNPVTDIGPLTALVNLNSLHLCCAGQPFVDRSPLEGLTKMEYFNIGGRQLDDAMLAPIVAAMPNLLMLWVSDNNIGDGSVFTDIENLGHLAAGWNDIEDISFVADIADLWSLELQGNPIADFTPLAEVNQLQHLLIGDTGLSDVGFLEDFTSLVELGLEGNDISDISALVANSGIDAGDVVNIADNALDLDDPAVMADIQVLLDRGVDLTY